MVRLGIDHSLLEAKVTLCLCVHANVIASIISDSLRPYGLYVARQAPLAMGFSRQEYWRVGCCSSPPGDLPWGSSQGIEPIMSPALAGGSFTTSATWEAPKLLSVPFNTFPREKVGFGMEALEKAVILRVESYGQVRF